MNAFEENLKNSHKGDLLTLLKIYWENKPIYKSQYFRISILFSAVILIVSFFDNFSKIEIIKFIANQAIDIFPNILGFNLGGYILLISLNVKDILTELTEPDDSKGENFSFYQKMSSVFAFSILLQISLLIVSMIFTLIIEFAQNIFINDLLSNVLNSIALFLLSFLLSYSTLLIFQIVLNVFNFGQVLHFFFRVENLEHSIKNKKPKK
jgi:hypothetical protein